MVDRTACYGKHSENTTLNDEDGGTIIACRILIKELLGKTTATLKRL